MKGSICLNMWGREMHDPFKPWTAEGPFTVTEVGGKYKYRVVEISDTPGMRGMSYGHHAKKVDAFQEADWRNGRAIGLAEGRKEAAAKAKEAYDKIPHGRFQYPKVSTDPIVVALRAEDIPRLLIRDPETGEEYNPISTGKADGLRIAAELLDDATTFSQSSEELSKISDALADYAESVRDATNVRHSTDDPFAGPPEPPSFGLMLMPEIKRTRR